LTAVAFGLGALACVPSDLRERHASRVEVYLSPPDAPEDAAFAKPQRTLGAPDGRTLAIPRGSFVVVRFFRPIPEGPGPDLRVYELGPDGARARVAVSADGSAYFELSQVAEGPTTDLDFAESGLAVVTHVRIRGLDDAGTEPGFDLDALEALQ